MSSPLPVAVRVDVVAADDGDPATTEPVIGHATAAVIAPRDGQDETATTPTVPTTAEPAGERAADVPGEGTPDDVAPPSDALFVGSGTAAEVAGAYLDDRLPDRVDGMRVVPGSGTEAGSGGGEVVEVRWEIADDPEMAGRYSGTILLRSDPGGWSVLRATTDQISLDVARDGDGVAVAIDWTDPEAYDGVDMTLLDAGGRPVSDDVFVMFATPGVTEVPVERGVDPASVRSVLVRHVGGTWFSITEVHLP